MDDLSSMECEIAILIARIKSSEMFLAHAADEPSDRATAMIPLAYAFFEVLVQAGQGTGVERDWGNFLRESLGEVIRKNEHLQ